MASALPSVGARESLAADHLGLRTRVVIRSDRSNVATSWASVPT